MSNDNGGEKISGEKIIKPDLEKAREDDGTILTVKINKEGSLNWTTKMPPPQLNFLLDTIKAHLFKPQEEKIIRPPGGIMNRIRQSGAFGKGK